MGTVSFKGLPSGTRYITKNLIVGAQQRLFGLRKLKNEGVNIVIDVRKKNFLSSFLENFLCRLLNLKRVAKSITFTEKANPEDFLKLADVILKNKNGKTFLHCRHGLHRSVMVAAVSRIKEGAIKTREEFEKFLKETGFFESRKNGIFGRFSHSKSGKKRLDNFKKIQEYFASYFFKT